MSDKTCGECKYFVSTGMPCRKIQHKQIRWTDKACDDFGVFTVGDRIQQMNMQELAELFALSFMCDGCPINGVECVGDGNTKRTFAHCYDKLFSWLNSPKDDDFMEEIKDKNEYS